MDHPRPHVVGRVTTLRRTLPVALLAVALTVTGCSSVSDSVQGLRDRLGTIDVDAALEGLRDCDALSEKFVELVGGAADVVDELAERSGGRLPATQIREVVDDLAVSRYYDLASRLGCAELQLRLDTLDRLRGLTPDTPAGADFLQEVRRQVESA